MTNDRERSDLMTNDYPFSATYHLDVPHKEAKSLAESILIEQTVETPLEFARRFPFVREHMMGEVTKLEPVDSGGYCATLRLPIGTASVDAAQFLNVLFGNVSLHTKVQLLDFDLPPALTSQFSGPHYGVSGLRELMDVHDRALTSTALKPVGLSLDELGHLCETIASGGIDLIKDDHYLADHTFCPFEDRVATCLAAVRRAQDNTGRPVVYAPNLSGSSESIKRQIDLAHSAGVQVVMMAPMLVGLPQFKSLVENNLEIPVLAHPSFAGSSRIAPETMFGKLFRLFGADAVIFANYGGRFSYSQKTCVGIAETARAQWHHFKPAMPVPAGGMAVERSRELVEVFGLDTMLLIGGSLLNTDNLLERTRLMVESVKE